MLGLSSSSHQVTNNREGWPRLPLLLSNKDMDKPYVIYGEDVSFLVLRDGPTRLINLQEISSVTTHYIRDDKAVVYIKGVSKPFQTQYSVKDILNAINAT